MIKRLMPDQGIASECPSPHVNVLPFYFYGFDLVHMRKQPNHTIPESQTQTAANRSVQMSEENLKKKAKAKNRVKKLIICNYTYMND